MNYSIATLMVGILWTTIGLIKDDFNFIVGAQVWFATTIMLASTS